MSIHFDELSDIEKARASSTIDVAGLTAAIYPDGYQRAKEDVLNTMLQEPAFDKSARPYQSRAQRLAGGISAIKRLLELKRQQKWTPEQFSIAMELLDDTTGLTLHEIAFKPVIASQGSDEQQAYWMPKILNHAILGCYAQTELGHGSNVQGLETTATYDPQSQQFEIHSPTLASTKWWIGGAGLIATHCVVQAILRLPEGQYSRSYGPHLFLVQLRDTKSMKPQHGITIGEIGPKVHGAMAAVDNGFICFNHVRIPRAAMLSRFAQVTPDGTYRQPPHAKLSYGGMLYIRAQMITGLAQALAKAATISIRYLHSRRQFQQGSSPAETQVIRYPGVHMRVIPAIIQAFVFMQMGQQMAEDYETMAEELKEGNSRLLAETHAMSAGLKRYVSDAVVEGCETCRRACGGHGFMASAGIGAIYSSQLPSVTYEGDNYILAQQVCRAAAKGLHIRKSMKQRKRMEDFTRASMLETLEARASIALEKLIGSGKGDSVWTDLSWECLDVAKAITEAQIGQLVSRKRQKSHPVLDDISDLWLSLTVEKARGDLLEYGIVSPLYLEQLRNHIQAATSKLLPDLIGISDSFNFSDFELNSTLGRRDGQPYETLFKTAKDHKTINLEVIDDRGQVLRILEAGQQHMEQNYSKARL